MEQFDKAQNKWHPLASMNAARGRFDASMLLGKIYAVGGSDGTQELNTVECYDPNTDTWSDVTPMKYRRSNAGTETKSLWFHMESSYTVFPQIRPGSRIEPGSAYPSKLIKLAVIVMISALVILGHEIN